MNKEDTEITEKQIMDYVDEKTGIECKPVPPSQLSRIEKMLKWLIVRKKLDYLSHDLEHNDYRDEYRKPILDEMFRLGEELPDISDIVKSGANKNVN